MSITRTTQPDTPAVHAITKLGPDIPPAVPTYGFRLWEKAVMTAGGMTAPAPLVTCAATGHAGWTPLLMAAGMTAIIGTVVRRGLAEAKPTPAQYAPAVEYDWSDYGDITETAR